MLRSSFRGARVACIFLLLVLPSLTRADEPGFGKVQDGDQLRGCGITIGYSGGQRCVLTAAHCLRGDIRFDGYPAKVLARDDATDIALLTVEMPAPSRFPVVAPDGVKSGSGTRYGYPDYKYTEDACGINDDGSLTVKAIPGASGGPIVSTDGCVVGIVTHTTSGVPAHKIRAFMIAKDCSWLLKPVVARSVPAKGVSDPELAELQQAIADFAKEADRLHAQRELMFQRWLDEQDRLHRQFLEQLRRMHELDD